MDEMDLVMLDIFFDSPVGDVFLNEYNLNKEFFQPLEIQKKWNISDESKEFLSKFGWPSEVNLFSFITFIPQDKLLEPVSPKAIEHGYGNVAYRDWSEFGILNTLEDNIFLISSTEVRYFAKSIPLVICYGMIENYATKACSIVQDEGVRAHIPEVLKNWQYAENFFEMWDPDLWQKRSIIASRAYDISSLLTDIDNNVESW
jgi:hypothetical protein